MIRCFQWGVAMPGGPLSCRGRLTDHRWLRYLQLEKLGDVITWRALRHQFVMRHSDPRNASRMIRNLYSAVTTIWKQGSSSVCGGGERKRRVGKGEDFLDGGLGQRRRKVRLARRSNADSFEGGVEFGPAV